MNLLGLRRQQRGTPPPPPKTLMYMLLILCSPFLLYVVVSFRVCILKYRGVYADNMTYRVIYKHEILENKKNKGGKPVCSDKISLFL